MEQLLVANVDNDDDDVDVDAVMIEAAIASWRLLGRTAAGRRRRQCTELAVGVFILACLRLEA